MPPKSARANFDLKNHPWVRGCTFFAHFWLLEAIGLPPVPVGCSERKASERSDVEGETFEGQGVVARGDEEFRATHGTHYYIYNEQDPSNDCALKSDRHQFVEHAGKPVRVVGTVEFVAAASGMLVVAVTDLERLDLR